MLTKEQALTLTHGSEIHRGECVRLVGARNGIKDVIERWRVTSATQTWKTRPDEFRVPVKRGLYAYGEITERNAHEVHTSGDCNLRYRTPVAN